MSVNTSNKVILNTSSWKQLWVLCTATHLHSFRSKALSWKDRVKNCTCLLGDFSPFMMATLCEYSLSPSPVTVSSCHSQEGWFCPWPRWGVTALFLFFFAVFPTMFVMVGRLRWLLGSYRGQFEFCVSVCVYLRVWACIWPKPAEYPTACLLLLLLTAEGVWSGLGPAPSYLG